MRVAINGLGRIGKQFLLVALEQKTPWDFVINETVELDAIVYSLQHDSVHPSLKEITHDGKQLLIGKGIFKKKKIKVFGEKDPALLPWAAEKIDLVVECTGFFTDRESAAKHLAAGAKKVLISAPAKNHDATLVCGVNNSAITKEHTIISAGSCTTNCVAILIKVLHDALRVKNAFFVTTHAYTATQHLIDAYDKKDFLRGRAAAINIIPTISGASQSVVESIPELQGRIEGYALRIPIVNGSFASVIAKVEQPISTADINALFKKRAATDLKGILQYNGEPLVSTDIIHNSASCVFDANFSSVQEDMVSIAGWYDNEWGYANRLVDAAKILLRK